MIRKFNYLFVTESRKNVGRGGEGGGEEIKNKREEGKNRMKEKREEKEKSTDEGIEK